jgi:hypothetical protein
MQHLAYDLCELPRVPVLEDVQQLSHLELAELVVVAVAVDLAGVSQRASLKDGEGDAEGFGTAVRRAVDHRLPLALTLLTLFGGCVEKELTEQEALAVAVPAANELAGLSRPGVLADDLDVAVLVDEDVFGLDVADDSVLGLKQGGHLHQAVEQVEQLLLVEGTLDLPPVGDLRQQRVEVVLVAQLGRGRDTEASPPVPQ